MENKMDNTPLHPAIACSALSCGYSSGHPVLRDVSFSIGRGEFVAIIGPNGTGKTTLFRALSGMLPLRAGMLAIDGTDSNSLSHKERARKLAIVNQTVEGDSMSVEEYVLMGRLPYHSAWQLFEDEEDFGVAMECMKLAGIYGKRRQWMDRLSGGEQQLAAIARALAQQTGVLLLDEPTSHLDISHQMRVLDLVQWLNRERNLTVLLVIHDLNLASEYGDRLLMLKDGMVYTGGTPAEVLTEENIRSVYEADVAVRQNPLSGKPCIFPCSGRNRQGRQR